MNVSNNANVGKVSNGSHSGISKTSSKNKWKMPESLKDKIVELANEDAKKNIYMGNEFKCLRKSEVAKVAPDRAALIAKFDQLRNTGELEKIQAKGERWLYVLFGIEYEAEFESVGFGSAIHIYNEDGEEVLTYTGGVGWHEKETKAESAVHSALRFTYFNAYQDAKKGLNSTGGGIEGECNNITESNFDMKV